MTGKNLVEQLAGIEDVLRLNLDIRHLTTDFAIRLMDHHLGMGQSMPFAFGAAGHQNCPATGSQADAIRRDFTVDELHRVVDGHCRSDRTAGRIHIQMNVLAFVFGLQIQQLHHDQVGDTIVDDAVHEDDAILQQQVANPHLPLARVILPGILGRKAVVHPRLRSFQSEGLSPCCCHGRSILLSKTGET